MYYYISWKRALAIVAVLAPILTWLLAESIAPGRYF